MRRRDWAGAMENGSRRRAGVERGDERGKEKQID
jgi:hypothetical protein